MELFGWIYLVVSVGFGLLLYSITRSKNVQVLNENQKKKTLLTEEQIQLFNAAFLAIFRI